MQRRLHVQIHGHTGSTTFDIFLHHHWPIGTRSHPPIDHIHDTFLPTRKSQLFSRHHFDLHRLATQRQKSYPKVNPTGYSGHLPSGPLWPWYHCHYSFSTSFLQLPLWTKRNRCVFIIYLFLQSNIISLSQMPIWF